MWLRVDWCQGYGIARDVLFPGTFKLLQHRCENLKSRAWYERIGDIILVRAYFRRKSFEHRKYLSKHISRTRSALLQSETQILRTLYTKHQFVSCKCFSAAKTNKLMSFMKTIAVYCNNQTEEIYYILRKTCGRVIILILRQVALVQCGFNG